MNLEMKRILYITGIFAILSLMSFVFAGDFYSSMTKVEYVEANKSLKFTMKLNTNHASGAIKINQNAPNFDSELQKYVNRYFSVIINGVGQSLTFTGSQVNGESVWVYFEANGISEIKTLKIKNAVLMDAYPNQSNILNISYKGQQKTMSFQRGRENSEASF